MPSYTIAPDWDWVVVAYLFTGGLAGGLFILGALLHFLGRPADRPAARIAFLASLPVMLLCPIFLISHLGMPERFWHMLIDTSEGGIGIKFASPISLGSYLLLFFGAVDGLVFLNELLRGPKQVSPTPGNDVVVTSKGKGFMSGTLENVVIGIGLAFALGVIGYTGVLLSVSSQPGWSDSPVTGGLFAASALATSAAFLALLLWLRQKAVGVGVVERLGEALFYFIILELVVLFIFTFTAGSTADLSNGPHGIAHYVGIAFEVIAALLLVPMLLRSGNLLSSGGFARTLTARRQQLMLIAGVLVIVAGVLLRYSIVYLNR